MSLTSLRQGLVERFGRRNVIAAVAQLVVFLGVVFYTLTLGSRALVPLLSMVLPWAALILLSLYRPWDLSWDWSWPEGLLNARRSTFDPGIIASATAILTYANTQMVARAKERLADMASIDLTQQLLDNALGRRQWIPAWQDDTYGMLIVSEPVMLSAIFPVLAVLLAWFFLPR